MNLEILSTMKFFADLCSHWVLEQSQHGCLSSNFGQLREATKIQNGHYEKDRLQKMLFLMCNTSSIEFWGMQNSFLVLFF